MISSIIVEGSEVTAMAVPTLMLSSVGNYVMVEN